MSLLGWLFWSLNAVVTLASILQMARSWTGGGKWGLATPGGWIWVWHALGVGLVPFIGWSPWHLLWWFPVGFVVCTTLARVLYKLGWL
jgi:hypothetical protein